MHNKIIHKPEVSDIPKDLIKPPIIEIFNDFDIFRAGMNYRCALERLQWSRGMIVEGSYATAIALYTWLKKRISSKHPVRDYISSRRTKELIHETTRKIFLEVKDHKINLHKSPENPFLKALYPDKTGFIISLPDILGMNGAWQWCKKGIVYPVLEHRIHPFYGVYFPMREKHLVMFDQWIKRNKQKYKNAIDIGTGCGILSFVMAKHGIKSIYATDINPNAVYSTRTEAERLGLDRCIDVERASLFGSQKKRGELVVFNPPWLPGDCYNEIDRGIYYDKQFFQNFFNQAENGLDKGNTLAIIFSTFAIEAGLTDHNPVEKEINNRQSFVVEDKLTRKAYEEGEYYSKSWLSEIRTKEKIELWIIKKS